MKTLKQYLYAFFASVTFLTNLRIPFFRDIHINDDIAKKTIVFYPVVGLIYGLSIYGVSIFFLSICKLDIRYLAMIILSFPLIINKFLHFDGLLDSLDACLANKTKKERLDILKDSHIGSFAFGGGMIIFGFKFLLIYDFLQYQELLFYLILIPILSRFLIVLLSYKACYPRKTGTGSFIIGKISNSILIQTISLLAIIIFIWSIYFQPQLLIVFTLLILILLFFVMCRLYAYRKIGGITGDVLGASLELSEVLIFIIILLIKRIS